MLILAGAASVIWGVYELHVHQHLTIDGIKLILSDWGQKSIHDITSRDCLYIVTFGAFMNTAFKLVFNC